MSDRGGGYVANGEVPEAARSLRDCEFILPAGSAARLRELLGPPSGERLAAIEAQLATVLELLDTAAQVKRLELHPGDRLAILYPKPLHPEVRQRLRDNISPYLPEGVQALMLDGGFDLAVLSADAADAALREDALRAARAHLLDPSPTSRERLEKALDLVG